MHQEGPALRSTGRTGTRRASAHLVDRRGGQLAGACKRLVGVSPWEQRMTSRRPGPWKMSMSRTMSIAANWLLVAASVIFFLLAVETFLRLYAAVHTVLPPPPAAAVPVQSSKFSEEIVVPPEVIAAAKSRMDIISLPKAWEHRPTQVSGAARAEIWQGALEVYNQ